MNSKTVLITGATSGIGKETARQLAVQGLYIILVARDHLRGETTQREIMETTGNRNIDLLLCDLSSLRSVRKLAQDFKQRYTRLDVLINNAGSYNPTLRLSEDGYELTFAVNHLAHFLLTKELLPILQMTPNARIINVASEAHRRERFDLRHTKGEGRYNPIRAYNFSKLCNILFTRELAKKIEGTGVTANSLHPGLVASNFWQGNRTGWGKVLQLGFKLLRPIMITNIKGAETSVYLATSPEVTNISGKYFDEKHAILPSAVSQNDSYAKQLWDVSEEYCTVI